MAEFASPNSKIFSTWKIQGFSHVTLHEWYPTFRKVMIPPSSRVKQSKKNS